MLNTDDNIKTQNNDVLSMEHYTDDGACKICTRHLESLCYQRAWWFWAFRQVLAAGVHLFAFFTRTRSTSIHPRSPYCHSCLRFRKNALKRESTVFCYLDKIINPLFNSLRDSLLTQDELSRARILAKRTEDPACCVTNDSMQKPEQHN